MSGSANSVASGCSAAMDAATQKRDVQPEAHCAACDGFGSELTVYQGRIRCRLCSTMDNDNTDRHTDRRSHAAG